LPHNYPLISFKDSAREICYILIVLMLNVNLGILPHTKWQSPKYHLIFHTFNNPWRLNPVMTALQKYLSKLQRYILIVLMLNENMGILPHTKWRSHKHLIFHTFNNPWKLNPVMTALQRYLSKPQRFLILQATSVNLDALLENLSCMRT